MSRRLNAWPPYQHPFTLESNAFDEFAGCGYGKCCTVIIWLAAKDLVLSYQNPKAILFAIHDMVT